MNKVKQQDVGPKAIVDSVAPKERKTAVTELIGLLCAARARVFPCGGWCANAMFLDANGRRCGSGAAQQCDALGALQIAHEANANRYPRRLAEKLLNAFAAGLYGDMADCEGFAEKKPAMTNVNDIFGHGAVVRVYDETLRWLRDVAEGL